jgi:hypothetical protein
MALVRLDPARHLVTVVNAQEADRMAERYRVGGVPTTVAEGVGAFTGVRSPRQLWGLIAGRN